MASFVPPPRSAGRPVYQYGVGTGRSAYTSPAIHSTYKYQDARFGLSNSSDDFCSSPPRLAAYASPVVPYNMKNMRSTPPVQRLTPMARLRLESTNDRSSGLEAAILTPMNFTSTISSPNCYSDSSLPITATFDEIIGQNGMLEKYARDKIGCRHLQDCFPMRGSSSREKLYKLFKEEKGLIESLFNDVFGNFFMQVVIERSKNCEMEQRFLCSKLLANLYQYCLSRYSCRVVQKAVEIFPHELKCEMLSELSRSKNLLRLATDQNANHVIQKVFNICPLPTWVFIIQAFVKDNKNFFEVCENKYGCRVIQLAIEVLAADLQYEDDSSGLLERMMMKVIQSCERLAANEFANYVVQNVLMTGKLCHYRDEIIEKCLLRNLLSLSQEKYASHVVEKAFEFAPPHLLSDMMEEIFNGYVPHPETGRDALDILLFHQYGNYVVQRMLELCCEAVRAQRNGIVLHDMQDRLNWFQKLYTRVTSSAERLTKYSSGKKILDMLEKLNARSSSPTSHYYGMPSPHYLPMQCHY